MNEANRRPALIFEEKKAIKLFLWLFYILYIAFDCFLSYLIPRLTNHKAEIFSYRGPEYIFFVLILCLLPISIYFIKKGNPFIVKYFFLVSYIFIDFTDNLIRYLGTTRTYASGNIVDVLIMFFAPVFVNKKYFRIASIGIIGKYLLIGLILHSINVIAPLILLLFLSGIAFILLVRFYSYITSLTKAYEELRQKEKLAVVGQMAAAIGHEIRNPLASLKGFTQLQNEQHPNTNAFYPIMIDEIDRIDSIVNDLLYIGKPKALHFEKANIKEIISYTVSITKQQAETRGINIEVLTEESIPLIDCDENRLKQVFINLIKNAIEAMPNGGKLKITAQKSELNNLSISIEDEGCGISEDNIKNLGEPFFSTKKDGTGLGLMVTNQIIQDHGGTLNIKSDHGKGTRVDLILPMLSDKAKLEGILHKRKI